MADLSVQLLAALTGFFPAFALDGVIVHKVKDGSVRTIFTDGTVKKGVGVVFILIEILFGAGVAVWSNGIFEQIFEANPAGLALSYLGVIMWLAMVARVRIGGNYSGLGYLLMAALFIGGAVALGYGTGQLKQT